MRSKKTMSLKTAIGCLAAVAALLVQAACAPVSNAPIVTAGGERIIVLEPRHGVTMAMVVGEPRQPPVATVLLFAGGSGDLGIDTRGGRQTLKKARNFAVRTRTHLRAAGMVTVVVDSPSDAKNMMGGFRTSPVHADDIAAVIDWMRNAYRLPIWLHGTSRGTESAANAAVRLGDAISGVVFSSSITVTNLAGTDITELPLHEIHVPSLILAHRSDACDKTPPEGAERIRRALRAVPAAEVRYFDGPVGKGRACGAAGAHGFVGVTGKAAKAIARFIRDHTDRGGSE